MRNQVTDQTTNTATHAERTGRTFYGIQTLRAIAAMLVVLSHSIYLWHNRVLHHSNPTYWMNGSAGVDIFFVISGFVMMTSCPNLAKYVHPIRIFLNRRLTRIIPLYWITTALKIAILVCVPTLSTSSQRLTLLNTLGSFLFFPTYNAAKEITPIVDVGWTLNYEMFFYILFAFALLFKRRLLHVLLLLLICLSLIGLFHQESWPPVTTLASPLLVEFLFGVIIARLAQQSRLPSRSTSWVLLIVGSLALLTVCPHLLLISWQSTGRFLLWGVPAAAIVFGSVGLERDWGGRIPKWITSLGDASYSIYLVQTFILPAVGIVIVHMGLKTGWALFACILAGCSVSAFAGTLTYLYVEGPMLNFFKRTWGPSSTQASRHA